MKLQLSSGQAAAFAVQAGPYKNLAESTQAVLDAFHQSGHDPYTRRDVCAVISSMGGPDDPINAFEGGEKGESIINPLIQKTRSPKGRGYYTQASRPPIAKAPVSPEAIAAENAELAERGVVVELVSGLVWMPEPIEANENLEGWYAEDEGLRQIAVSQSKCFGNFSANAPTCKACPLVRWCSASGLANLDDIASELDSATEREIQEAERAYENARLAAQAAARAKAAPPPVSPSAPAYAPPPLADDEWPTNYKLVPLPFDGVCSECEGLIKGGDKGVHLTGVGMLHINCARDRIAKAR